MVREHSPVENEGTAFSRKCEWTVLLNREHYNRCYSMNSSDFEEHIISGGNHAQFGDYGKQPHDIEATLSADSQQEQTAEIIIDWLARHR